MDKQYSKQVLKEFIERDRMLRENSVKSDYDKFCETICRAIETILEEKKELKSKYDIALSDLVKAEHKNKELKAKKNIESVLINNKMHFIDESLYEDLLLDTTKYCIPKSLVKKKKLELKAINFDTADDRDYIIRILDELIGEEK